MNKIIINRGSFRLDEVVFEQGTTTIGRASDNTISLDDSAVSSHHAKIVTLFHTSYIEDLGSTNGTLVNGKPIYKHTLHSGDVIAVGNHQLLFQSDKGAQKPTETSETVMLRGNEIKQKLSEFMQAQLDLEQRQGSAVVESQKARPSPSATAAESADDSPAQKSPVFRASPILDKEKNQAWFEPKSAVKTEDIPTAFPSQAQPITAQSDDQPVIEDVPPTTADTVDHAAIDIAIDIDSDSEHDSIKDNVQETHPPATPALEQPNPQSVRNTATALKSKLELSGTNAEAIKAAIAAKNGRAGTSSRSKKPTIDIAAAARAATQRRRSDENYAADGVVALNRGKSRLKIMPMIWMLIVTILIVEVVYITYRSLG